MNKELSLLETIKTKYVKISLGNHTYRMRLLTLTIFGLAVIILLIAIIVLIIVNACSSSDIPPEPVEATIAVPTATFASVEPEIEPEIEEPEIGEPEIPDEPEESPEPTVEPEETPAPSSSSGEFSGTLKTGDSAEIVKVVQQRLVDLYYMDYPVRENGSYSVTSKYGSTTSSAVKLFQERNDLTPTGDCDEATYKKLISPNANSYSMRQNDKCNMVKVIQTKLKEKGYLDKATGFCGNDTITAVTNFQKASGLTPDGIAGPGTLKILLGH